MKQAAIIDKKSFTQALEQSLMAIDVTLAAKQQAQMSDFYAFLIEANNKMNLTAITEPEQVAEKHIADSLRLLSCLGNVQNIADVGTGAGLPGIPLAIALPETQLVLVESMQKRVSYLQEVTAFLKLKNVSIVCARAEEAGQNPIYREKFDVAMARAVAVLPVLCEYLLPLLKKGGKMLAMKGRRTEEELFLAKKAITVLGGGIAKHFDYELSGGENRSIIMVEKSKTTPKSYPRRVGIPASKPL